MIRSLISVLLFFSLSVAQQPDSTASDSVVAQTKEQGVKLFLDKIEVQGSLEKPQAVFILPGRSPEIEDFAVSRSFLTELFRPIEPHIAIEVSKHAPLRTEVKQDLER